MAYHVRLMRREDIDQVTRLDRAAFPTLWPPTNYFQELRNQRNAVKEWSWLEYVAVVLQLMALLCLFAGLTMGGDITVFFKWLGTGVLVQLAVIAILMFDRQ